MGRRTKGVPHARAFLKNVRWHVQHNQDNYLTDKAAKFFYLIGGNEGLVLEKMYLALIKPAVIAKEMSYSYWYIIKLHNRGLRKLEKILGGDQ